MERKPSYEELAASIVRLERELALRKQEGESLHGSSSMLRLIFDAVDVGIILLDAAGTITFANRRMAEMFGRGVEEVIGIPYTKLTHETHSGQAEAKLRELIDGTIETVDVEGRYQRKDGSEFWGQLSGSRLLGDDGRFLTLLGAIQDITRRRIADEKLRESGEIMRYIVKHDPNAIAVFDRNLNYVAVSDRYLRDYDVQESDILGKHHYEVFPEIPGKWKDVHRRCLAGAVEGCDDDYFERPDGSITYTRWECRPWYRADGEIGGIVTYTEVITERKLAEKALQESNRRLMLAMASGNMGVFDWDIQRDILSWDDRMLEIYGIPKSAFKGCYRAWESALHPDDREKVTAAINSALKGEEEFDAEFRIVAAGGIEKVVRANGSFIRGDDGRAIRMIGLNRDVTKQWTALYALRENEEKFRRLFNLISDAVFLIDNETGRILEVNEAAENLYGYPHDELIELKNTDMSAEPSETTRATEKQLALVPVRHHRKKDGTVFPVEIAATHFEWARRRVHLAAIRDISFRVQAEKEKAALENQLRQAQKLEAIGRLAGGVAHDFNNLLAAIIGFSELVREDLPPQHVHRDSLEEIHAAGIRGRDLTRSLLAFGRKQVLDVRILDLNEVISKFERLISRVIGEDIELKLRLSPDAGRVVADVSQLEQVLMNLAINARDAMPRGGLLMIETDAAWIDAESDAAKCSVSAGPYALITVSDTGSGIDPEIHDNIFEPFFTTKSRDQGTGLGLATVYGIVKQHGGNICLTSEPGRGSAFKIYLPNSAKEPVQPAAAQKPSNSSKGSGTILVVEDDPAILRLVRRILEREGYTVIAPDGQEEAIREAITHAGSIDLLLTDVIMPGMNGAQVRERVAACHPCLKTLFMSGYTKDIITKHGILMEGAHLLNKPFEKEELLLKVRSVLEKPGG